MKILAIAAAATLVAVAPVAAQHTTVVHKTVVMHHDEHMHAGPSRHQVCVNRWDARHHHRIRHCSWR